METTVPHGAVSYLTHHMAESLGSEDWYHTYGWWSLHARVLSHTGGSTNDRKAARAPLVI